MGCSITYRDFKQMYGNLNFPYNATKNNKIHRLPQVSRVVVTLCVYGGLWSGLDATELMEN